MSILNLNTGLSTINYINEKSQNQNNYVQKDNLNLSQIKTIFPDSIDQIKIKFNSLKGGINEIDLMLKKDTTISKEETNNNLAQKFKEKKGEINIKIENENKKHINLFNKEREIKDGEEILINSE